MLYNTTLKCSPRIYYAKLSISFHEKFLLPRACTRENLRRVCCAEKHVSWLEARLIRMSMLWEIYPQARAVGWELVIEIPRLDGDDTCCVIQWMFFVKNSNYFTVIVLELDEARLESSWKSFKQMMSKLSMIIFNLATHTILNLWY